MLDRVTDDREVLVVKRRGGQRDVAIIAADELSGLMETAYLLRSRKNAERLVGALQRAEKGEGRVEMVEELRKSVGL